MLNRDYDRTRKDYMARFAQLPDAEQKAHLAIAIAWLLKALLDARMGEVDSFDLEHVAHATQDAIDAEFYELLADAEAS